MKTKNICIYFLPYSGGKFIANCLALSRHVVVSDSVLALQDLRKTQYDYDYYKFKLQLVMRSLPIDNKPSWHEFDDLAPTVVEHAHLFNKTICHVAHWTSEVDKIKAKFSDTAICKLVNYSAFNSKSFLLKSSNSHDLARHQIGFVSWDKTSYLGNVDFDVDAAMHSQENFLIEIKKLYDFFEFTDFQPLFLSQFYQAYISLHQ